MIFVVSTGKMPNHKHQITNKSQIQIFNDQNSEIIFSGNVERASKRNVGAACSREFKCCGWKPLPLKFIYIICTN